MIFFIIIRIYNITQNFYYLNQFFYNKNISDINFDY